MKYISLILLLIFPLFLFSQKSNKKIKDEEEEENPFPKVELGLNFGGYFANKYTANYYNGARGNVNDIYFLFSRQAPYDQIYYDIMHELGASDEVLLKDLPGDMHYHVALTGGLFLRYNVSRNNGIFLEGNYAKLNTDDVFTVLVDPQHYTFENIVLCGIHGQEERINIDLGYHRKFPVYKNKMNLFLEGALNTNFVKVLKTYVTIGDLQYDLINSYDQAMVGLDYQQLLDAQSGFGFGFLAGGGVGFTFTPTIGLEAGANLIYNNVNLEGYNAMKPSGTAYIRLMISGLLQTQDN